MKFPQTFKKSLTFSSMNLEISISSMPLHSKGNNPKELHYEYQKNPPSFFSFLQRGVLHRRSHSGGEPGWRPQRWLAARKGDTRQRARVIEHRGSAVGQWSDSNRVDRQHS